MSFLDLYSADQAADLKMRPNEAHDLPATFSDTYGAAWSKGRLFDQSVSGENARMDALQDYLGEVKQKTGKSADADVDWAPAVVGVGPVAAPTAMQALPQINAAVNKMLADNPGAGVAPLDEAGLEQRAVEKSRAAQRDYAEMGAREKTFGGKVGMLAGGFAASAADPINLMSLPLAPETEAVGVLAAALRWGAVGAAAQTAIEYTGSPYKEEVQPGYSESGEPLANIAGAFAGGALLGGGTKALGNLWTRYKTGAWPTAVRDAGNVVESHANVQNSNVYLGAEGEAAHWEALDFSMKSIADGEPVDVSHIITPQIEQARQLMVRLQGERAASLPVFDARQIAITSEEAGLRSRAAELEPRIASIPEGDATAADRLNRLQAVEQQIAETKDPAALRGLNERRDQILVDTNPEALKAGAAPFEQKRAAQAEQDSITARLAEIARERDRIKAENLSQLPAAPPIGQTSPIRAASIEAIRQDAIASAAAARAERAAVTGEAVPELPFEAAAAEAHAQTSSEALSSGVSQIAERAGYAMPKDEADRIAAGLKRLSAEDADDALRELQVSPRQGEQIIEQRLKPAKPAPIEPVEPVTDVTPKDLSSPEYEAAVRADIDRERIIDDKQIPVGVDQDGNVVYRGLNDAMDEVDQLHAAAEQIASCAAPAAVEGAT